MKISPLAGKPAPPELLTDVAKLVTAYFCDAPDPENRRDR
jgi:phosphoglucomutase